MGDDQRIFRQSTDDNKDKEIKEIFIKIETEDAAITSTLKSARNSSRKRIKQHIQTLINFAVIFFGV